MQRIEINVQTGEQKIIELTPEEIAEIQTSAIPVVLLPNWDTLYFRLLAGDLKPIYEDIKKVAKTNLAINIDYTNIIEAFKIRTEQTLADCLKELMQDGYVFKDEHRNLWNNAISELNFSDLVKL